jgi:HD-GYP domain-containing protein (c-di-GMP phosphodiesterase class II)
MLAAAALVRDVGMAQVPSPILRQKGPLIAEHRRLIQDHPQQSTHAVKALALPEEAQKIILHHHERIDGQGYPSRLSGDDIPIGARVIAIVDAMEAMTSSRVYRHAALTREEARAELQRSAGSQFDPQLVEKFLDV